MTRKCFQRVEVEFIFHFIVKHVLKFKFFNLILHIPTNILNKSKLKKET